ncbi:MAG: adenylate/guanylate cyclase domain-containing protein [Polaromonas sp.]|nr:adenylate/guanylate cyclase domain-containing protein [Polaromonas sp.]
MTDQPFAEWLVHKSWTQGVRYSKVVACLLPPAALAIHLPTLSGGWQAMPVASWWLLGWQLTAELFFLAIIAADRLLPASRSRALPLNLACIGAVALATWIGAAAAWRRGDLSIYAAGLTFVATVMCTPRPVRRPMYLLSFVVLGLAAAWRHGDALRVLATLVNPFCVVVLCIELDKFSFTRNLELYTETRRAEAERARADRVLHNVLPASIAEELKREGKVRAVQYDNMGVLFADIAGFTAFSRTLPPDEVVRLLNRIFSSFDELVENAGLEKIKTIGDAYMAVSHDGVAALGQLALDMQAALERCNGEGGTRLAMRIGIHAGPAVAGVIGVKRFLYDVWGDTVNVASRMESSGEPGAIQVTQAVFEQTKDRFSYREREAVDVRGLGVMSTWWLLESAE